VALLVGLEVSASVRQVNGEVRHLQDGIFAPPVSCMKLAIFTSDDDLASESQISVEPSVPETTSVELHSKLLESSTIACLGNGS